MSFIIAGIAKDPELAKAEMLGYYMNKNLPDFRVKPMYAYSDVEYMNMVTEAYSEHQWELRRTPKRELKSLDDLLSGSVIIYRESGELIGNTTDFINHVKHAYAVELEYDENLLAEIAQENGIKSE